MHSAPHRTNSDFQLRHFIAGSCHTPDGAWSLLYEQMIDIQIKLEATKARLIRRQIRREELQEALNNPSLSKKERMALEADLIEFNSGEGLLELALKGAEQELASIKDMMKELEPMRQFAHLPILEASEAAQRLEWLGEFKTRCENYLVSMGTIPHDQIETMRKHPDFQAEIVPFVQNLSLQLEQSGHRIELLQNSKTLLLKD
jgi:hypothetical protein